MNPRPLEQGSWWPAHGYCEMPSTCWPGCSGSQANCEIRACEPTGTAPAPVSLKACSEVSMQKLYRPWSAASDGWNWSVGAPAASTLSLTVTGADQVLPPSIDCENRTSICRHPAAHLLRYYGRATGGRSGWERATGSPAAGDGGADRGHGVREDQPSRVGGAAAPTEVVVLGYSIRTPHRWSRGRRSAWPSSVELRIR